MNTQSPGDARAQLETQLVRLLNILNWIDARWQEKVTIEQRHQQLVPLKTRWGVLALVLWTVGLVIALFTIGAPVMNAMFNLFLPNVTAEWADANTGIVITVMLAIPLAVSVGLAFLIVLLRNKLILPWQLARLGRINQQRETHNVSVEREWQRVYALLNQASRDLEAHLGGEFEFPQKYLNQDAVSFCVVAVRDHRARTVIDAINLYVRERTDEQRHAEYLAASERLRKTQAVGNVVNAVMQGAMISTVRQEGKASRAAQAAANSRIEEQLKKPVDVYVKRRW